MNTVNIGGKSYNLAFTLAAMGQLADRFGGLEALADMMGGNSPVEGDTEEEKKRKETAQRAASAKMSSELPWLVATMANQGIKLAALEDPKAKKVDLLTPDTVGLLAKPVQFRELMEAVVNAINDGMRTEHEAPENPEVDVTLQEIESKNVVGAAG